MLRRVWTRYLLGAAVGLAVAPALVHADRLQLHGSACAPADTDFAFIVTSTSGVGSSASTAAYQFYCPLYHNGDGPSTADEGDNVDYRNATAVYVDVQDNNDDVGTGRASAQVCLTSVSGGTCGGIVSTGDTTVGASRLQPPVVHWTGAASDTSFAYIRVTLPDQDASNSILIGYTVVSS